MHILVSVASKHGSTAEIGREIGRELANQGFSVEIVAPEDVVDPGRYQAAVIGSAVYAGHWRPEALELVDRAGSTLSEMPVWLFSSGPIGSPPKPEEDPIEIEALARAIGASGHRLFAGRLDRQSLNLGERAIVTALRAPYGDYRDWASIRIWAKEIAAALDEPEVR